MLAVGIGAAVFYSPLFTHYIEGDAFRAAMEKETAKVLHFLSAATRRSDG